MRNRSEAILVKIGQGKEWLQVYKEIMVATDVLKESVDIRRTRGGDILIQLKMGSNVREIADKLNEVLGGKVHVSPMQDKVSVEIKNIDPLVSKEELIYDIERKLEINDIRDVEI
jgi:hypothetical protein